MLYRIMAEDECGTELCLANDVSAEEVQDMVEDAYENFEEYRAIWAERQGMEGPDGFCSQINSYWE